MALLLTFILAAPSHAETLRVTFIEKPPYYFTDEGESRGFLTEKIQHLLLKLGHTPVFESVPARRALLEIHEDRLPVCGLGWFKTTERLAYANFSVPIYRDKPFVAVTLKSGSFDGEAVTLRELLSSKNIHLVRIAGYSYGAEIDALIKELSPAGDVVSMPSSALAMLAQQRADLLLLSPEEFSYYMMRAPDLAQQLHSRSLTDIPLGQERYLMCSRRVPQTLLDDINKALAQAQPR